MLYIYICYSTYNIYIYIVIYYISIYPRTKRTIIELNHLFFDRPMFCEPASTAGYESARRCATRVLEALA